MLNKNRYLCQLPSNRQEQIKRDLVNIGLSHIEIKIAMDSKLYDLENTLPNITKYLFQLGDFVLINFNTENNLFKLATFIKMSFDDVRQEYMYIFNGLCSRFALSEGFINRQGITFQIVVDNLIKYEED